MFNKRILEIKYGGILVYRLQINILGIWVNLGKKIMRRDSFSFLSKHNKLPIKGVDRTIYTHTL